MAPGVSYQRSEKPDEQGRSLAWLVVRVDLERNDVQAVRSPGNSLDGFRTQPSIIAAIDGGYFEPDHAPSGWLLSRGQTHGVMHPRAGSGVLIVRNQRADVISSTGDLPVSPPPELAVQCGPRLVEREQVVGIHRDDGRRFARTAACVRSGGRILDFVLTWSMDQPLRGPGLLHFARLLAQPSSTDESVGCEVALNLDGGPSTGAYLRASPEASHPALGPVPWALVITAR
jgi:uncharacterized protein YigE (DUF2233 family)